MDEHQVIISRKEKPHSFETGKAGNRFTLYFDTPQGLKDQIEELKELGIMTDENA